MADHGNRPIETLRLSAADKQKLVDYVDQQAKKPVENCRRAIRVNFGGRNVLIKVYGQESQTQVCTVVPRNLSRRGLAFVHGRFVYPDSKCEVTLPMLSGKWCVLEGVVRRCRHVRGIVHEVSVVFDEAIDLNQFARLTTEQAEQHLTEMTEDGMSDDEAAHNSRGRVLLIDDLAADRRLFSMWLERMHFTVQDATDARTALQLINQSRFDMYIIDANLADEDGVELISHLRGQGVIAPIISASATDTDAFRKRSEAAGASVVMAKPFTFDELKANVLKIMSISPESDQDDVPLQSTLDGEADMAPLIAEFVNGLGVYTAKLRNANADADFDNLAKLCINLKGAGASHGFSPMTDAAKLIIDALDEQERDADRVRGGVNQLMGIIRRVQSAYEV